MVEVCSISRNLGTIALPLAFPLILASISVELDFDLTMCQCHQIYASRWAKKISNLSGGFQKIVARAVMTAGCPSEISFETPI